MATLGETDQPDGDPRHAAAARLYRLAVAYGDRSHAAQAALVQAFEREAAGAMGDLGEVVIEDDDDEQLRLTERGTFSGRVLARRHDGGVASSGGSEWELLSTPDDVVDFYDPVDLFDDLADSIVESFPEVVDADASGDDGTMAREEDRGAPSAAPWLDRLGGLHGPEAAGQADVAAPESAGLTILRDLHAAGVFSDAEFERRKAELGQ